jgi:hypothetical protein
MTRVLLAFGAALLLSSCSVMAVKKHVPHFKNTRELAKAKGSYSVLDAKGATPEMEEKLKSESLSCRLTTFNMPANTSVANFLKDALTDELDAAEKLNLKGDKITIVVKAMDSDTSGFNTGSWALDFDYIVGTKTHNVKTKTDFESAYAADTACRNTANALTDALTDNFTAFYKKLPR